MHHFLFLFIFFTIPHDMWDLSSLARDRTHAHCTGVLSSGLPDIVPMYHF